MKLIQSLYLAGNKIPCTHTLYNKLHEYIDIPIHYLVLPQLDGTRVYRSDWNTPADVHTDDGMTSHGQWNMASSQSVRGRKWKITHYNQNWNKGLLLEIEKKNNCFIKRNSPPVLPMVTSSIYRYPWQYIKRFFIFIYFFIFDSRQPVTVHLWELLTGRPNKTANPWTKYQ